jgi:predicted dehydrogenase
MLEVNWLTPEKQRELTLIGDRGVLRARYLTQEVVLTEAAAGAARGDGRARVDDENRRRRFALRKQEPLRAELTAFAECVLADGPEPVSAYDGARALAVALALRDSSADRRPVELLALRDARAA